jgi:hypothetical protein
MNPTSIAIALAAAGLIWFGGDHFGHTRGINEQKVADQGQFDKVNKELADQKTQANTEYRALQADNLVLATERDKLKTALEKSYEENRRVTDARRDKYADVGLQFDAAKDPGHRACGESAQGSRADPAVPSAAEVVQLPRPLTANLRWIVYDADKLNDEYRKCYEFVNKVE